MSSNVALQATNVATLATNTTAIAASVVPTIPTAPTAANVTFVPALTPGGASQDPLDYNRPEHVKL